MPPITSHWRLEGGSSGRPLGCTLHTSSKGLHQILAALGSVLCHTAGERLIAVRVTVTHTFKHVAQVVVAFQSDLLTQTACEQQKEETTERFSQQQRTQLSPGPTNSVDRAFSRANRLLQTKQVSIKKFFPPIEDLIQDRQGDFFQGASANDRLLHTARSQFPNEGRPVKSSRNEDFSTTLKCMKLLKLMTKSSERIREKAQETKGGTKAREKETECELTGEQTVPQCIRVMERKGGREREGEGREGCRKPCG